MKLKKSGGLLYWALILFFTALTLIALFGTLGTAEIRQTDEATYGMNVYEMLKSGNLLVNTLRYEVDYYNSKPPLILWVIALGYKLFGVNPFGLRFFSALAGLMVYAIGFAFMYRTRGRLKALVFAAFFPACTILFEYHMFRAGDMDAFFLLWALLAIISLYASCKNRYFLILYGLFIGLAFMTKASHVLVPVAVGILFIPLFVRIHGRKAAVVLGLGAAGAAALVIVPWALMRMSYDGTAYFHAMFVGETTGRVRGNIQNAISDYVKYTIQLLKDPICLISLILSAIALALALVKRGKEVVIRVVLSPFYYLMISWFVLTIFAYSITRSRLPWYIYPAYIPLIMLGADAAVFIFRAIHGRYRYLAWALLVVLLARSAAISIKSIVRYPWVSNGGSPRTAFYDDMKELSGKGIEDFSDRNAYIETTFNLYNPQGFWEQDYIFYAYSALDVNCVDGGVGGFLETDDPDAILILDKNLWETYAPVLTGHVILEDNSYLVFNKHMYGEDN